jgi:hypothetical protein
MKLAAVVVLAFILVAILIFLVAGIALSAARRARLRVIDSDSIRPVETDAARFSREILEARNPRPENFTDDQSS